jgi:transcriptional regulator with XRE-family HTH domain
MTLVEKIQAICDLKGITIYRLETDTHLTKGSIRRWDESSPSSDKLLKVAKHLNISMDSLLNESALKESITYDFYKKVIDSTEKDLIEWVKYGDLIYDKSANKQQGIESLEISSFTEFDDKKFLFDDDNCYYAKYKDNGYLLAQITITGENVYEIGFFIFKKGKFYLHATSRNLNILNDLYKTVKQKAIGVDDVIEEFLNDDFGQTTNESN